MNYLFRTSHSKNFSKAKPRNILQRVNSLNKQLIIFRKNQNQKNETVSENFKTVSENFKTVSENFKIDEIKTKELLKISRRLDLIEHYKIELNVATRKNLSRLIAKVLN
jgi:hypothetical protein